MTFRWKQWPVFRLSTYEIEGDLRECWTLMGARRLARALNADLPERPWHVGGRNSYDTASELRTILGPRKTQG